jgi:hypothetical protein
MASLSLLRTFVILSATLALLTPPSVAYNILYSGEYLYANQALTEGSYNFIMQNDCNLVLYDNGQAVWASGTAGRASGCFLSMQYDGNLVIYSGSRAIWASNTQRARGNFVVVLQRDRNVVLYGPALWSTGTYHLARAVSANVTISRSGSSTDEPVVFGTETISRSGNSTEPVVIAGDKISMVTDMQM